MKRPTTTPTKTASELAYHVLDVAIAFRVSLMIDVRMDATKAQAFNGLEGVLLRGKSFLQTDTVRAIIIAPVRDHATYAIALHELGHCLAPGGSLGIEPTGDRARDLRIAWDEELAAWEWAKYHALEWTEDMRQMRLLGLRSRIKAARKLGITLETHHEPDSTDARRSAGQDQSED